MEFDEIPREQWHSFFDRMSKALEGKVVEIEIVGLDLGDQIATSSVPLNGISYESASDTLYVYTEGENNYDHAIPHPREIFVEIGETGLDQVVIVDSDDHKQFVRMRAPLELPSHTSG